MPGPRKDFLKKLALLSLSPALVANALAPQPYPIMPSYIADNSDYWAAMARQFEPAKDFINLENGYCSPMPKVVKKAYLDRLDLINTRPAFYMRRSMENDYLALLDKLSLFCGVEPGQIALSRNTTESLNTVFFGFDWKTGDQIICTDQDYGSMSEALEQLRERYGVVLKTVKIPLHPDSDAQIVSLFEAQTSPRTRMMLITEMINLTGQILPAAALCALAREKNIVSVVDAAHSFAHIDSAISIMKPDFYAASLHKWTCAPLGAGLLYVSKPNIKALWPLLGDSLKDKTDIRKLNHIGTTQPAVWAGLDKAIDFNNAIPKLAKQERLRSLQRAWSVPLRQYNRIKILTPAAPLRSCAIGCLAIDGVSAGKLSERLYEEFKIFTVALDHPVVKGIRITPHLYTSMAQIETFVEAVKKIAGV